MKKIALCALMDEERIDYILIDCVFSNGFRHFTRLYLDGRIESCSKDDIFYIGKFYPPKFVR